MKRKLKIGWSQSIQTRMIVFFMLIFVLILGFIILPWELYVRHSAQQDTKALAKQRLSGLDASISMLLDNRDRVVNIMMLNRQFEQQTAENADDLSKRRTLMQTLTRILVNDLDLISAAYIGNDGEVALMASSNHSYRIHPEALSSGIWVQRLKEADNEMTYFYNSGGLLEMTAYNEPYISFVRSINSTRDFDKLGVVLLNMTSKRFGEVLFNQMGGLPSQVYLCDGKGTIIAKTPNAVETADTLKLYFKSNEDVWITNQNGNRNVICRQKSQMADLTYISVTTLESAAGITKNYPLIGVFVVFLVAVIIFISQLYMSRLISKPLAQMCEHMHMVEMGQFVPIPIANPEAKDEITQLQLFFERMVKAIDALVIRVAEKEKLKRKHEISLIQEQVKPHFLYNALDAISALSLIGDNQTAYTLTQALSAFYRTSLSGGHEVVTVKTEISCIKDYITVLNIRYENKIKMTYEIAPEIEDLKILKLTLQPLIENAVYHGIRQKKGSGSILLSGVYQNDKIVFTVEDDGAGMTQERIKEILSKRSRGMEKGFGLYSLMEKLELFYNVENLLEIQSALGQGTKVILRLPVINDSQEEEKMLT